MKPIYVTLPLLVALSSSAAANDEITLRIGSGSVQMAKNQSDAQLFHDIGPQGGGIVLNCKRMQLQRDATTYWVHCYDVKFIAASGLEGLAPEAKFDLKANRVLLNGAKDKPVQLIRETDHESDILRLTAENVEMHLTPLRELPNKSGYIERIEVTAPAAETLPSGEPPVSSVPVR